MPLSRFHPAVQRWFTETLGAPTSAQIKGWEAIRERRHTLIAAPTGSGKTLAAFLTALDELFVEGLTRPLSAEVRVIYVSPLKALSTDIDKNLAAPRLGIRKIAEEMGLPAPSITTAVRTGDTTSSQRAAMLKTPPHILVTTPESLYLLLTAERSRDMLRSVRTVIVDEIHALIGTRRGAHLALTLERLQQVAEQPLLRLGLSATQKPIEEVGRYLVGAGCQVSVAAWRTGNPACPAHWQEDASAVACATTAHSPVIVNEGHRRAMDLTLELPKSRLETVMSTEVWGDYYERLTQLIEEHRTTLVFVNTRKMAERIARQLTDRLGEDAVTAHHGSLSKENRLDAETRLKEGRLKALVATASLELGIDIGSVDLVCQIGSPHRIATLLQRVGRSGHSISGLPKGRVFPVSRDDLVECAAMLRAVKRGELDAIVTHDAPLDVLAQQIVAESACQDYTEDELFAVMRRAWPYRDLERKQFDDVLRMVAEGFATKRGRRAALVHRDEVNGEVRGRRGARMLALTSGGAIPKVADYRVVLEPDETFIGTLNEDFAIESNVGDIFQLGNMSWRVLQVSTGIVRVADAQGAPPSIPFWLGEAPARSDELSRAVASLRADFEARMRDVAGSPLPVAATVAADGELRGNWQPATGNTLIRADFEASMHEVARSPLPVAATAAAERELRGNGQPATGNRQLATGHALIRADFEASTHDVARSPLPVPATGAADGELHGNRQLATGNAQLATGHALIRADFEATMYDVARSPLPVTATGAADGELRGNGQPATVHWLMSECGIPETAAAEIHDYLAESLRALGVLPTQETLILERFFDESGGMQLVLHAPFGSRINKAWGLALRKRFCRQFDFELQAAATEDAILLSLGPQHSFPLADVFRYLHPATARDVLVQAFLDAPVWQTRWRWNATVSLAVPRNRNGKKVAPQLQRTLADDLMAAVFPDAAACFENIGGDRQIPDHPLVNQAVRDCLEEAMDFEGLARVLTRIHANELQLIARDTPEPSPLSHGILNAAPYAFLDDAPLEERRTQAVYTRRAGDLSTSNELGALDPTAIARVRDEERPDPRDADELHDALLTAGFLTSDEAASIDAALFETLVQSRRAACVRGIWIAAERINELRAIHPTLETNLAPPRSRDRAWSREEALIELLRGRMTILGPTTANDIATSLRVDTQDVDTALLALENEGTILRGSFTVHPSSFRVQNEWCDRRLLARIHRYTIVRLRAEIEPVTAAVFQRFLFAWQHVAPHTKLSGIEGLQQIIAQLDGYEVAAGAWERAVLPARMDRYEETLLDMLCLTGEVGWARLSAPTSTSIVSATPIALYLRDHEWRTGNPACPPIDLSPAAQQILETLRTRGASFSRDLDATDEALGELVSASLITSDGFAGLRALIGSNERRPRANFSGRWSLTGSSVRRLLGAWESAGRSEELPETEAPRNRGTQERGEAAIELHARTYLRRYGVVFRRLLAREPNAPPWRELAHVYRRLEARGEIRGGRFVHGMSGEQFALPDAIERMREIRRQPLDGTLIVISAADPLNLTGILDSGERIRAATSTRIAYRDGVAVSVMEGDYVRPLIELDDAMTIATALAGRRVAAATGFVGR